MKKILFGIFILCYTALTAQDTTRVLFIGNSYTYVNSLPDLFKQLSSSAGRVVITDQSTPGGYTLENHSADAATLSLISQKNWNFVILQEQSQYPTIEYYRYNSTYPFAKFLDSLIHIGNAQTVFYMTWGRRFGGEQCIGSYCSPVFRDFFHMQDSLKSAYLEIGRMLGARVARVGEAWRRAVLADTSVVLWDLDNSHPALIGSYLAACVFYCTIFNANPVGLTYTGGLSSQDAYFCQTIAYQNYTSVHSENIVVPKSFVLYQNYPNPFNQSTIINFGCSIKSNVCIKVYDVLGKEITTILNEVKDAGKYSIRFNAANLTSGVYFYRMQIEEFIQTKQMIVLK